MQQCFSKINELMNRQEPFVCVTFIQSRGHAPQDPGARALIGKQGLLFGTIGGGKVEAKAIELGRSLLDGASGLNPARSQFVTWNLQRDVGMSCGGEVSLFFETFFRHDLNIAVFGAGHVAQQLVPLLLTLDCRVTCLDSRAEWLEKLPASPQLKRIQSSDLASEVRKLPSDAFILLMTQGHAVDFPILREVLLTRNPPYLGVIGSPVKAIKLRKELRDAGVTPEKSEAFYCPMGLHIGGNHPGEIAISMAAQILEVRDRLRSRHPSFENFRE